MYSPDYDNPYNWWNSIIDGRSSLSRLAMVIFSITPHSASCERLFSSLGWIIGKRRTNLDIKTIETMAKIYRTSLTHIQKSLNYGSSVSEKDIERMLEIVHEEGDLLNEDDENEDNEVDLSEPREEITNTNEALEIEHVIDLGPWVFIDNSELPAITRRPYDSEDEDEDWDPDTIIGNI